MEPGQLRTSKVVSVVSVCQVRGKLGAAVRVLGGAKSAYNIPSPRPD